MKVIKNHFSIIIPLYNKERYIQRAINSILNQTYQNFEIIIINDGSTDKSKKKASEINDQRINIYNQQNQGVSVARNWGVENSKNNLVTFLDADDVWKNTFLEEMNKLVNQFPDAVLYGTNNYFEYPNGYVTYEKYDWLFEGEESGIIDDYFDLFTKIGKSPFSNSNYCIKKSIFKDEGGYKTGVRLTEDSSLWCRIALKYSIAYLTKPLATYYMGTQGSTHFIFEPKEFEVTNSLQNALILNLVKPKFKKSVRKLIAFQKLSLIKRSILTGHKYFALKRVLNFKLFKTYPFVASKCFLSLLIPSSILLKISKKNYF